MAKRFFDTQNSFWHWLTRLPDLCGLSLCWLVCSLPVVTLAPACMALYDAVARNLREDIKGGYRRFFRTFKNELGRGCIISLIWLAVFAALYFGLTILINTQNLSGFTLIYQVLCLLPLGAFCWLIPLQSRFVYTFAQVHKNALLFTVAYLPKTGLMLLFLCLGLVLCRFVPVLAVPMPALLALLQSFPVESVLKKMEETDSVA